MASIDKLIPKYPNIIPELSFRWDDQCKINNKWIKHILLATFFHKRIQENDLIYIVYNKTKKKEFMPLFTLTKCLAYYNDYIENWDEYSYNKFIKISEHMVSIMDDDNKMTWWKHKKTLRLPWYPEIRNSYSCLFNWRWLGMLIRYYQFNPSDELLKKIEWVLNSFEVKSDKWWVMKSEWDDDVWYLEYSYWNWSPVVFNGLFSSLVALYDVYLYWPESLKGFANSLFDKWSYTFLKFSDRAVYRWKFLQWLTYDDNKLYFADWDYFNIELKQIDMIFKLTGEQSYKNLYDEWKSIYKNNKIKWWLYEWYYFVKKRFFMK